MTVLYVWVAVPLSQRLAENGFLWSNGNSTSSISVSPTTTTTYTVTVTDANNCTATSAPVVNVNALPVAAIAFTETSGNNSNDGTICSGASVSLNASGGTSYVWSTGDNTSAAIVESDCDNHLYG
jgi:cytoskeletal protein RodZ